MRQDIDYLEFLVDCIVHLENYTKDIEEDEFLRNDEKKDSCLTRLIMIGEYSAKISDETKNQFSGIEWQLMKSSRNYFVHVYRGINWRMVWETIRNDMPTLKIKIEKILSHLDKET